MKKKLIIILSIIVVLLISTYFFISFQESKIKTLESQVEYLQEEIVPMAFEISNNSDSKLKLKVVFYDLNGNEVGSDVLKLNGNELHIDFKVIDFSEDSYLFFPYGLYTDTMAPADLVTIFDKYEKRGFPSIYDGIEELQDQEGNVVDSKSQKHIVNELKHKFDLVKAGEEDLSGNSHGVAIHDIQSVSKFKKGFVYKVVCHPHTGALETVLD